MSRTTVTRTIAAPVSEVFDAVADIRNFQKVVPDIVGVEFLSEQKVGVGARFKETRKMGKREATTELEITEYEPGDHVRLVSDAGGTIWDTVFRVSDLGEGKTELTMVMDAKAYKLLSKCMNPLIKGFIRKAIEKDMDAVKAWCEK